MLYLVAAFAEFLTPFEPSDFAPQYIFHPPQAVAFVDTTEDGGWAFRPHVFGEKLTRDPKTLKGTFVTDPDQKVYLKLFGEGYAYKLFGLIPIKVHLMAAENAGDRFYLLGADRLGRDMLSRMISGTRISMSIGLVGVGLDTCYWTHPRRYCRAISAASSTPSCSASPS